MNPHRHAAFGLVRDYVPAAVDPRARCLAVQLSFGNGSRVITGTQTDEEQAKLQAMLTKAWQREVTKNKPLNLPIRQVLTDEQSKEFFARMVDEFPQADIKIPIRTLQRTMEYVPEDSLPAVTAPILIVAAEHDSVNPRSESEHLFEKTNEPKSFYCVEGATHYEVYEGAAFEEVVGRQIEWFETYLAPVPASAS